MIKTSLCPAPSFPPLWNFTSPVKFVSLSQLRKGLTKGCQGISAKLVGGRGESALDGGTESTRPTLQLRENL